MFTVEKIDFPKPLLDQKITKVGDRAHFECKVSRENIRSQWFKDGQEIYK